MFNTAHWYGQTTEWRDLKMCRKKFTSGIFPPTLQEKPLKLCKKKKEREKEIKKERENLILLLKCVKSETKIVGYRKVKGLW